MVALVAPVSGVSLSLRVPQCHTVLLRGPWGMAWCHCHCVAPTVSHAVTVTARSRTRRVPHGPEAPHGVTAPPCSVGCHTASLSPRGAQGVTVTAWPRGATQCHCGSHGLSHGVTVSAGRRGCHPAPCHRMAHGCHAASPSLPSRSVSRSVAVTAWPTGVTQCCCHCMAHGVSQCHRTAQDIPHSHSPARPAGCHHCHCTPLGCAASRPRPCQPWGQPGDSIPVTGCPRAQREEGPQQIPVTAWHRSLCHRMTSHLGDTVSPCPGDNAEVAESGELWAQTSPDLALPGPAGGTRPRGP